MKRKHSFQVRRRAFSIWQRLGFYPWELPKVDKPKSKKGDFYKGAIPFLNDDAKRTFRDLLLRPGYLIRDYIKGDHEKYLAPLTALIVFYAFFALVSALVQPVQHKEDQFPIELVNEDVDIDLTINDLAVADSTQADRMIRNVVDIVHTGYLYLNLDQYPEAVKTPSQARLAALEGTLRSQGIPLFIVDFLLLWLAMSMALRRDKVRMSACAAASAYVLCQFSFFMLFALLLSWGHSSSIGIFLMLLLLVIDYCQWLQIDWKKGLGRAVKTGIYYGLMYGVIILAISGIVLVLAWVR